MQFADPLDAIDRAREIWPYNSHAVEDPGVEMAFLTALDIPSDAPNGLPILRRGCPHAEATQDLFAAKYSRAICWSDRDFFAAPCDRCLDDVQPRHTLWVNTGASVLDLHVCDRCRRQLDARLANLVWK